MVPDFIRYFVRDAIEGILAFLGAVNLIAFVDPSVTDPNASVHAILVGVLAALIAAGRRNAGRFSAYLNQVLNTDPDA